MSRSEAAGCPPAEPAATRKAVCVDVVSEVAARLGNTPAICRKCYIHPEVLGAFLDEGKLALWKEVSLAATQHSGLRRHEVALLRYLEAVAD